MRVIAADKILVVDRKRNFAFLQKAERQPPKSVHFCRNTERTERGPFWACRKMLFLQKDDIRQKDPLSVLSVFLQKETLLVGCVSAFCRKAKFLFRSTTNLKKAVMRADVQTAISSLQRNESTLNLSSPMG